MSDVPPGIWWTIANSVRYAEYSDVYALQLASKIHRAIIDEREACAKIADEHANAAWGHTEEVAAAEAIAATIRHRK